MPIGVNLYKRLEDKTTVSDLRVRDCQLWRMHHIAVVTQDVNICRTGRIAHVAGAYASQRVLYLSNFAKDFARLWRASPHIENQHLVQKRRIARKTPWFALINRRSLQQDLFGEGAIKRDGHLLKIRFTLP